MVDISVSEDRKTFQFPIQVYMPIKKIIVGFSFWAFFGVYVEFGISGGFLVSLHSF